MSFRQTARSEKRPSRGGSRGSFRNRYTVPKDRAGSPVILVPGEYPDPRPERRGPDGRPPVNPYHLCKEHRKKVADKKYPITDVCSSGFDENNPLPCTYCHQKQTGDTSVDGGPGKKARTLYGFNLLHLAWYHLAPVVDRRTKQVMLNPNTNEPYMTKVLCEGAGCEHCRDNREKVYGAKKYIQVGMNHFENLRSIDADIGEVCLECREGTVTTASFECTSCGHVIIDCVANKYTESEVDTFASEPMTCPSCRHTDYAEETLSCSDCQDPKRTGLFDVVLWLRRQGEATASALSVNHPSPKELGWCFRDDYELPNGEDLVLHYVEHEDGSVKPEWNKLVAGMVAPYDFDSMVGIGKGRSVADQAKRMQIANPFAGGSADPQAYDSGPTFRQ